MSKMHNLQRMRFGKLLVTDKYKHIQGGGKTKVQHIIWLCICDCGNEVWVKAKDLKKRPFASCGCYSGVLIGKSKLLEPGVAAKRSLYCEYKTGARRKNHEFLLTFEEFGNITRQNCYYCNAKPSSVRKSRSGNGQYVHNGIDRRDNAKGYLIDNAVPCCWMCNNRKSNDSCDNFIAWVNRVARNMRKYV